MRRRDFLQRTAYAAGLAGMASLPLSTLIQQAARAQASVLPTPSQMAEQIDHFVIVMMENRSFDHYFGWAAPYANASQNETYVDNSTAGDGVATGQPVNTIHHTQMEAPDAGWQGCAHPDPGHGWTSGRRQRDGGFLANGSGNDIFALTYFNEGELGFIHDAAKAYTLHDKFHCSLLSSTWVNRYYKWSGQSGGRKDNSPPAETLGNQWPNVIDLVLAKGLGAAGPLTAAYYNSDLPFSAVWGARGASYTRKLEAFYADCAAGTLPNVSIVDPPYRDGGGFDGLSADEHPAGDVRLGQAWMADVVNAFVQSPNYRRGALFIVYDEWGGFFDHVEPPKVPDDRASAIDLENFGQMGFRIPSVTVSPWTRNPGNPLDPDFLRVSRNQYGFESILKLIGYRFGIRFPKALDAGRNNPYVPGTLPNVPEGQELTRVAAANNIGESFDWANPDFDPPELPDPVHIASRPCSMGGGDLTLESKQAHQSDLAELEDLADRFGIPVTEGKPHHYFRKPDSVQKAVRASL